MNSTEKALNRHADLQDFVANAHRGDTFTTIREDMERVETYTATTDMNLRENRRTVILTTTATVAGMYETRQTMGNVTLDTDSIPGEVLDGVTGGGPSILQGIQSLSASFAVSGLLAAHQGHLPVL